MEPPTKNNTNRLLVIILVAIAAAGTVGWLLGRSKHDSVPATQSGSNSSNSSNTAPVNNATSTSNVKSLVSYTLPDAWTEGTCSNVPNTVYIIPNGTKLDCSANPSAPIKIYIDPQNTTDCQQLNNVQGVKMHVCISLYINGRKSLKAATVFPQSSSYSADTTVADYYIDTGKGVVKVEYTHTSDSDYQANFDQLANSIKVK